MERMLDVSSASWRFVTYVVGVERIGRDGTVGNDGAGVRERPLSNRAASGPTCSPWRKLRLMRVGVGRGGERGAANRNRA
jgi:hypothetical protein